MRSPAVILVEDDPIDTELAQRAIAKSGIELELLTFRDGQAALDFLHGEDGKRIFADGQRPTLMLLDLKMPRLDGLSVLKHLRARDRTRRMVAVMLTTSEEPSDVAACYDNGANGYIRKPIDFSKFVEVMRQIVHYWLVLNVPPPATEGA